MTAYDVAYKVFLSLILVLSVMLNTTACYTILIKVKKKELAHLFILSISFTNLMESIIGVLPHVITSGEILSGSNSLCIASGFAVFGFAITSISHLCIHSLNRTVAIIYPIYYFKYRKRFWYRSALISLCYAYGFMWASFPAIGWSKYNLDVDKKRCSLDWKLTRSNSLSYILSVLIFCNIFPGILIVIGLFRSKKVIYRRRTRSLGQKDDNQTDFLEKHYLKVFSLSSAMFFVTWTPYALVSILALLKIAPPPLLVTTSALLSKLSTVSNVLVNCFINKSFKKHVFSIRFIQDITKKGSELRKTAYVIFLYKD
ncbi:pinopsin [Hydra vulgaris]|nr:pinopsin-like [Hydra vulgaris]